MRRSTLFCGTAKLSLVSLVLFLGAASLAADAPPRFEATATEHEAIQGLAAKRAKIEEDLRAIRVRQQKLVDGYAALTSEVLARIKRERKLEPKPDESLDIDASSTPDATVWTFSPDLSKAPPPAHKK